MSTAGSETAVPTNDWPQAHVLEGSATGIDIFKLNTINDNQKLSYSEPRYWSNICCFPNFLFPHVIPRNLYLTDFIFPFTSGGNFTQIRHGGPEGEQKYCSTLSLASALDEGGSSTPHASRFIPEKKTGHPIYRMLCGPQGRSGSLRKNSLNSGIHSTCRPAQSESLYRLH